MEPNALSTSAALLVNPGWLRLPAAATKLIATGICVVSASVIPIRDNNARINHKFRRQLKPSAALVCPPSRSALVGNHGPGGEPRVDSSGSSLLSVYCNPSSFASVH